MSAGTVATILLYSHVSAPIRQVNEPDSLWTRSRAQCDGSRRMRHHAITGMAVRDPLTGGTGGSSPERRHGCRFPAFLRRKARRFLTGRWDDQVTVRAAGSRSYRGDADDADHALRVLRARWRTASIAAGWRFPSDWGLPEVDAVCSSALVRADLADPLTDLGRARAVSGAGLDETLTDVAALHAVLTDPRLLAANPDAVPARLLRLTALAWADVSNHEIARSEVREGLTGLS